MGLTPPGPGSGPDSSRAKLSVVPRSVSADNLRPGIQASTTDPVTRSELAAAQTARSAQTAPIGAGLSPRHGVHMAGSDRSADREKALESALVQIERQFGKGSVMRLGDEARAPVEVIPTGSIALDVALGTGGLPRGRVIEIYGPEGGGKTSLALHAVANAQRAGGIAAFIDAEHALDPEYARKLGVDTDALLVSQPDTGEQALEIADMLIRSGAIDIVVIDSVAALVPKAEIEGEMGDSHVGLQARLMSQALRKIAGALNQTKTTAIFINQLREKIGVLFGSPETTTGGKALKFYASVRLDVRRIETLKDGNEPVGNRTKAKVVKNKLASPFKVAEFDILYGTGISREGGLIDLGVEQGIVRKSGAWYTYDGDQLGQGKENARNFLRDNPDIADEIEKKIKEKLGVGPRLDAGTPATAPGRPGTSSGPAAAAGTPAAAGPARPPLEVVPGQARALQGGRRAGRSGGHRPADLPAAARCRAADSRAARRGATTARDPRRRGERGARAARGRGPDRRRRVRQGVGRVPPPRAWPGPAGPRGRARPARRGGRPGPGGGGGAGSGGRAGHGQVAGGAPAGGHGGAAAAGPGPAPRGDAGAEGLSGRPGPAGRPGGARGRRRGAGGSRARLLVSARDVRPWRGVMSRLILDRWAQQAPGRSEAAPWRASKGRS